jgi:hypothetical protein
MRFHQRDRDGDNHRALCSLLRPEKGKIGYPALGLFCDFFGFVRRFPALTLLQIYILTIQFF